MMRKCIVISLLLLVIVSCGYYEGVVQPTTKSYLSFQGNTDSAVAIIDEKITLDLDKELRGSENEKKVVLFQVVPGKHKVVVTKKGQEVVNRIIIVGDGATKEIQVP
jgi:vacuolar-type H+-ATPase subunit F/Vma7